MMTLSAVSNDSDPPNKFARIVRNADYKSRIEFYSATCLTVAIHKRFFTS